MADIKLDNIQITLPEEEEAFLDAFCAEEERLRSTCNVIEAHISISIPREMKQDVLGFPILCDLGSAVFFDTGYNGKVEALPYRAPEVILGAEWDEKTDIWSFGVLVSRQPKDLTLTILTGNRCGSYSSLNDSLEILMSMTT